jgi:D-alanyl-D-alanine carboxypeptidase/D-alanyl-D-alanine-endopeptidase (penicillin-binding protein 4)
MASMNARGSAVGLAVVAVLCAAVSLRPEASPAATVAPTSRPLWSPERLPALLAEAEGALELARGVDELLGPTASCLVVRQGRRPVLDRSPDLALTPASTQKVLVAVAALSALGRDFRFTTKVVAARSPQGGAVAEAWLVGGGDPFLATPEYTEFLRTRPRPGERPLTPLTGLVDGLRRAGVISLGALHGDDSRYDRARAVPTWKPSYLADNEIGSLGALVVDGGFDVFTPGGEVRAADPAAHAATELARLAAAAGITAPKVGSSAVAPAGAVTLAEVRSAPLAEVVGAMVRESDNEAAELLVRELGRHQGAEGSTTSGTAAVIRLLDGLGLPTGGLRLGDGSGLETTNRASCRTLHAALGLPAGKDGGALSEALPVAGRSGTLSKRLVGTPLEGKLRAKTGSLDGVTGLVGYVDGRRRLSFAFLANGVFSEARGRELQDRLVTLLANYPAPAPLP